MNKTFAVGVIAMFAIALGMAAVATPVMADSDRVCVNHKGKVIEIDDDALSAHLGHGDFQVACP